MKKERDIEAIFVDKMGKIAKQWGISEPSGRIVGAMLFSEEPLSQREIADKTGYTLSLVSPHLKIIEEMDIAKKRRGKGKEKVYVLTMSFIGLFDRMIKRFLQKDILPLIEELDAAKEKNPEKRRIIEKMSRDYKKVECTLSIFERAIFLDKFNTEKIKKILMRGND